MKATHALSHSRVAAGAATKLDLLVTFSADGDAARRGLNVALVIDRSGSMAGSPLRHAITAAQSLVNQLDDADQIAVVIYDDTVETIVESQPAKNRKDVCAKIGAIRAAGCTNLHGGWKAGCTSVRMEQSPERVNRVLLLTDGQANEGLRDPQKLVAEAREQAKNGIVTTTLGFGAQFNEDLLIGMAQAGEGHFYYIQSPEDAEGVFTIELEGLASVAAQGLVATLAPAAGTRVEAVLHRYPNQAEGSATRVSVGDVYGVEGRQLALGLAVEAPAGASGPTTVATLVFEYDVVADGAVKHLRGELPIVLDVVSRDEAEASVRNRDVVAQGLKLRIARAKEEAVALGDKGDHAGAAARLRTMIDALRADPLAESFEIAEEIEHLEHYADAFAKKRFDAVARKELRDQSYQATTRARDDLALRGAAGGSAAALEAVSKTDGGVVLKCVRDGGKLRVHVASDGYDAQRNVQFPRNLREDGVTYVAEKVVPSTDGSFYRVAGAIRRLVKPGDEAPAKAAGAKAASAKPASAKPAKVPATAADLATTTSVGSGVLVQCVKEGSKLRARVVSDGYDPNWNIRFPRSIREAGVLFVVDEVTEASGGGSYVASGEIKRLVQ